MIIRNFYEDKLSQASYLVGCAATGEAVVIDPNRDIRSYLESADSLGLRIVTVAETHIHADYLSGIRELAAATGATMVVSGEGGPDWTYSFSNDPQVRVVKDGDRIAVGNVSFRVLHTPGHTPEHIAFLLTDHPTSESPHSLFTGDFVFVGDVGRPDLLEKAANIQGTMEQGARDLFRSLHKLNDLPDALLLWPGHGSGSACGKSLGGTPVSSLGYERRSNWALHVANEDKFVDEILSGQPEPPLYFKEMKRMNKEGAQVLGDLPVPARIHHFNGQVVDIRTGYQARAASFSGALSVPLCKSFTGWAGWVVDYNQPVTLLADNQESASQAARDLATIGIDHIAGWIEIGDVPPERISAIRTVPSSEIPSGALILDVRSRRERTMSKVEGSVHIPFGHLQSQLDELPRDRTIAIHCASGARSPIAVSILRRAGFENVVEIEGGMNSIMIGSPGLVAPST